MALLRALSALILGLALLAGDVSAAPSEHRVKAVFLFNFSRFVDWPAAAFASPDAPFVIGVFGRDPFGSDLDTATRGETVNGRPLLIRRIQNVADATGCQILFIPESEQAHLDDLLNTLVGTSTLTVSDLDGSAQRGAMIRLVTDNSKVRLRVNVEAARAAGLTISSKLLRASEIVTTVGGG